MAKKSPSATLVEAKNWRGFSACLLPTRLRRAVRRLLRQARAARVVAVFPANFVRQSVLAGKMGKIGPDSLFPLLLPGGKFDTLFVG